MEFLSDYGLFLAKTVTLVLAVLFVVLLAMSMAARNRGNARHRGSLHVLNLNDELEDMKDELRHEVLDPDVVKAEDKAEKNAKKPNTRLARKPRKPSANANACTCWISMATCTPTR